jgi:hypothetical protein
MKIAYRQTNDLFNSAFCQQLKARLPQHKNLEWPRTDAPAFDLEVPK